MKRLLLLFLTVLIASATAFSQVRTINGTVTLAGDNSPIPGATILVMGTTVGTTTGSDGSFSLNLPTGAEALLVSFVGMKTVEVPITTSATYNISLQQDVLGVDEVIVVAYGTKSKEAIVGAVSNVGSEKLDKLPISSLDRALQGNVAGLVATSASGQPGSRTQVRIRGIGSMSGANEPLYVIDGMPILGNEYVSFTSEAAPMASREASNPLANLNPNDIEDITILKDAAASSLYGARAANGVILITTKRGKEGDTKFTLSMQKGFSSRTTENLEVMTAAEYEEISIERLVNAGIFDEQDAIDFVHTDYETDWNDAVYRKPKDAVTNNIEFSANGGNAKTQFFISGSYFYKDGHIIATDFERYASRINLDHKATDFLKFGTNLSVSYSNKNVNNGSSAFASPILAADLMLPNRPIYNEDGTYNNTDLGMLNQFNPIGLAERNENKQNEYYLIGQAYGQVDILENLNFRSTFNVELYNLKEIKYQNSEFGDGRNVGGRLREGRSTVETWTNSNVLNYNESFAEKHNVELMAGFEATNSQRNGLIASGEGFPSYRLRTLASAANPQTAFSNISEWSMISYLSQANYNYLHKYYLSGSIRRDGNSRFGENKKYGNFWSVGTSWRISEESFMEQFDFVDNLKFRASYGTIGNAEIGNYNSLSIYTYNGIVYNGLPGSSLSQYANPNLTWEVSKIFNLALDFTLFNRITSTVEYYIKKNSEFLFDVPVSATTGLYDENSANGSYVATLNTGELENRGVEFQIRSENIKGKFNWSTELNFAMNKNKILSLPDDQDLFDGTKIRRVGEDFQTFYLEQWAGVDSETGSPQWLDENGEITTTYADAERMISGSASPNFEGGFTNIFSYEGIELSAFFSFAQGHKIYDNWAFVMESDGAFPTVNQNRKLLERWQQPGDITDVPKQIWGGNNDSRRRSTRYLHNADFIRLKNLRVSYNLPNSVTSKIGIDKAIIFAMGQNLYTWTKYPGKDPEVQINGVEDWFYPPLKTITFGLSVSF